MQKKISGVFDYSYSRHPPFFSLLKNQKGSEGEDWELEVEELYE